MYKELKLNQNGAVAMITVIFIAILLTIVTTSFIRLTINEQRSATDDDLTTRAFYAAESGIQDAITAINTGTINNADVCAPSEGTGILSEAAGLNTSYTCQLIDTTPEDYQAYLDMNDSVFFKLESAGDAIDSFKVQWHLFGPQGTEGDGETATARADNNLPQLNAWGDTPAMLRLQIIEVDPDNSGGPSDVSREDIINHVGFLIPATSGSDDVASPAANDGPYAVHCFYYDDVGNPGLLSDADPGEYFCNLTVDGLADDSSYYLRISNLYKPTHIKVIGYDAADDVVLLKSAQVVIDVTGKASDVYRRVEERVNLFQNDLWPSFAILSADDICKNFRITDDPSEFTTINDTIEGSCVPPSGP